MTYCVAGRNIRKNYDSDRCFENVVEVNTSPKVESMCSANTRIRGKRIKFYHGLEERVVRLGSSPGAKGLFRVLKLTVLSLCVCVCWGGGCCRSVRLKMCAEEKGLKFGKVSRSLAEGNENRENRFYACCWGAKAIWNPETKHRRK